MKCATIEELLDHVLGAQILGGGAEPDGSFHLYLSHDRVLVVTSIRGYVSLALVNHAQESVH